VFVYGLFLALGFLVSGFVVFFFAREEFKEEEYMDAYLYTSFIALVCARIFYILTHFGSFGYDVIRYVVVREEPGLSLFGALAGGFAFLWYYAQRHKFNFLHVLDIFAVASLLGFSIASLGVFLGGGSFGIETNLPWGVSVAGMSGLRHPVEIYQVVLFLVMFVIFLYIRKFFRKEAGMVSAFYILGISTIIFLLEFLKSQTVYLYDPFSPNHVLSAVFGLAAAGYIIYQLYLKRKERQKKA